MKSMYLRNRARGMSIVEMMVAMAISLIGTIVIFQVYSVNEEVRRSATAGSDEQTSGLIALLLIERELRHAGYGLNDGDLFGCNMVVYDNKRPGNAHPPFPLAAVQIVPNAGATPDVLRVMYGGVNRTTVPVKLAVKMASVTADPTVSFLYGYRAGQMIVIGEKGFNCTIREITDPSGSVLITGNGSYVDVDAVPRMTRWNDPAGTPSAYTANGKVINLGSLTDDTPPRYNEITVQAGLADPAENNKLTVENLWDETQDLLVPAAEQIVQLKAEYGMDDGVDNGTVPTHAWVRDDGMVDRYTSAAPATLDDWRMVKTIRVAIVSRSAHAFKPTEGSADCDATPDYSNSIAVATYPVRWAYDPSTPLGRPIDVRSAADWRCYKYQVYETTVPLRNMLWSVS
jgi:type IV pilus assembly protein PilW